jgi:O-antigen/teichoic acid export membrane protein
VNLALPWRWPAPSTRHFAGALLSKLAPPAVQLVLLLGMARLGTLSDVGRLALASAASFTCGGLAELGFTTSLSAPRAYFGTALPPVRATRFARLGAGLAGSLVYCLLWLCGLGGHEPPFLIVAPLPALLALSAGYAGIMNADSQLHREGRVTLVEAALTLGLAGVLVLAGVDPLVSALVSLVAARAVGVLARMRIVRGLPQHGGPAARRTLRAHGWLLVASTVDVASGQIDVLAAGFVAAFVTLGVFSPLMRTAYGVLLIAEALSWSLYGRAGSERAHDSRLARFVQNWTRAAPTLGVLCACVFIAVAPWFIPLLLDEDVDGLLVPVLLFGGVIVARFVGFGYGLAITREGRQRERLPGLLAALVVLLASGIVGALSGSLTVLAGGRLLAEIVLAAAYALVVRRSRGLQPQDETADRIGELR